MAIHLSLKCHLTVDFLSEFPTRGSWWEAAPALLNVDQAKRDKRDKRATTGCSHGLHFLPLEFLVFRCCGIAAEELLSDICQHYCFHVMVPSVSVVII